MSDMIDGKTPNQIRIEEMEGRMAEIDKISPTLCTAKWLQSTLNLQNGTTHSCHHPPIHKIQVEDIIDNPSGLHNTPKKKEYRGMMLKGERPPECQYCWNIEDLPGDHFSDRTYKSSDANWSTPFLPRVLEASAEGDVNPSYLEVSFSNVCNMACTYCSPDTSSKWMDDIRRDGAYPTSWNTHDLNWIKKSGRFPILNREENPYQAAFWKWWPELYWGLSTFRITGGEPLLDKNTWKILDYILENPRPDFNLAINTNLNVPDNLIQRLIDYHNRLQGKINSFEVFTSAEATGDQCNYIRHGMDYVKFKDNCHRFLAETDGRLNFMVTFNILSITTFKDFLHDIWEMRVRFNETDADNRIPMMINYLRWPVFMDIRILSDHIKRRYSEEIMDFVNAHTRNTSPNGRGRIYLEEVDQCERLIEYMFSEADDLKRNQKDFSMFFHEFDKRRGTDLVKTFPELEVFYLECLNL